MGRFDRLDDLGNLIRGLGQSEAHVALAQSTKGGTRRAEDAGLFQQVEAELRAGATASKSEPSTAALLSSISDKSSSSMVTGLSPELKIIIILSSYKKIVFTKTLISVFL